MARGGDGDDLLLAGGYTSNTLTGDDGDDTIIGTTNWQSPSANDRFTDHVGGSSDMLDGGDGDDVVRFDLADTVTGGAGADHLTGFLQQGETTTVTDFDPAEDSLRVNLNPSEAGADFGNVGISESEGNTLITLDGQVVLRIEGRTGLSIGFAHGDSFGGSDDSGLTHTDPDGNAVRPEALDVIIDAWEGLVT